jgi:hypothetical protein
MLKPLLIAIFSFLVMNSIAQIPPQIQSQKTVSATISFSNVVGRSCGTVAYSALQDKLHPDLANQRMLLLSKVKKIADDLEQNGNAKSNVVRTIPVVVHVVYNNATQNISDAQIQSQINILNQDFRNTNTDNVPTAVQNAFGGLRSDTQIEFCFAQRDPNGNPTNGITRTSTTHAAFYLENDVKFTSTGGRDAWDATKYLNLWVCDLGQDLLGYAQPPGFDASTDGVVIRYNSFGNIGNVLAPYNKGRTATHEIGHWLGLRHIWGDEPNCAADDNVNDTPKQKDQNGGCPSFPQTTQSGGSCSGTSPGSMFMNYMDYTDDACMYMFTNGQSILMNAALTGTRNSLLTSDGCVPISTSGNLCDTLDNIPNVFAQAIYTAGSTAQGYLAGHNSYGDLAKAEKFTTSQANYQVKGCILKFSRISSSGANSSFNVKVWDDNAGLPNNVLSTKSVVYSSIAPNVLSQTTSFVSFTSPANVLGNFYVGVEYAYSGTDTLALYTTTSGNVPAGGSKAFEKWSNGTWHNINTPSVDGGWGVDISFFIFPIICDKFESVSEVAKSLLDDVVVFPNPANDEVFLNLASLKYSTLKLYDLTGNNVQITLKNNNNGIVSFDVSQLSKGIYFVEIKNNGNKSTKKLVIN